MSRSAFKVKKQVGDDPLSSVDFWYYFTPPGTEDAGRNILGGPWWEGPVRQTGRYANKPGPLTWWRGDYAHLPPHPNCIRPFLPELAQWPVPFPNPVSCTIRLSYGPDVWEGFVSVLTHSGIFLTGSVTWTTPPPFGQTSTEVLINISLGDTFLQLDFPTDFWQFGGELLTWCPPRPTGFDSQKIPNVVGPHRPFAAILEVRPDW